VITEAEMSGASINQGELRDVSKHQKLEKARKDSPLKVSRQPGTADTLVSDLRLRDHKFLFLKPHILCNYVRSFLSNPKQVLINQLHLGQVCNEWGS
jgi:hypothetical protein